MKNRMTIFGAGHHIARLAMPWLGMMIALRYLFPAHTRFASNPSSALMVMGTVLVVVGLAINFVSAVAMMKAFKEKRLLTGGTYGVSRNPMYASFIFLTIPGLALLLNAWPVLTTSVVLYIGCRLFVKAEETFLEESFGEEFRKYRERVGFIAPRLG